MFDLLVSPFFDSQGGQIKVRFGGTLRVRPTRSGGILKTFYSKIKDFAAKSTIARIFITGVTTIQLDSMVSGLSIAKNFTANAQFTTMFGFTETELRNGIPQLVDLKRYG